ncbi:MAG: filamentous hemagglutinin N-terminal domain-containing protein, partial [Alphaproteobacteria bacterium]|nr:filamentous hemagglutinin N-terminal domain-containing protein [Alphaproteobacteria bacterium]
MHKTNKETEQRTVVPERSWRGRMFLAALLLAMSVLPLALTQAAVPAETALPQNPSVVSGQASVSSAGSAMTVQQSTDKAIINWGGFDIGSSASVTFQQPNSSSATLNRVIAGDASQIMGRLSANGQVYIVNPNGVIFGAGSQVNVAGLVASTMDITDADFEAGEHVDVRQGATGEIVNEGTIQATSGGYVLLLGAKVTNVGTIKAPVGKVVAAAGERVSVPLTQSGLVSIEVDAASVDASITNKQGALIEAADGSVYLSARAASDLAASIVNEGIVRADSVTLESSDGSVFLDAGSSVEGGQIDVTTGWLTGGGAVKSSGADANINLTADYISLSGAVSADNADSAGGLVQINGVTMVMLSALSNVSANGATGGQVRILSQLGSVLVSGAVQANGTTGVGGKVEISGKLSAVLLGAQVSAAGAFGGGTIHVGGSWQGAADLMCANTTTVDTKTTLTADATDKGNGGEVVLWSQDTTSFYGSIYARGGSAGGDGGRVELSSAGELNVQIAASNGLSFGARHASGADGFLLIDPMNVVIGDPVASFEVFKALLTDTGDISSTASLDASGSFGYAVALNNNYALISSYKVSYSRGDAYLYNLLTGLWTDLATTTGQPITGLASSSYFGTDVALNDNYALIGAHGVSSTRGNAYLYNLGTGAWTDLATTAGQPITGLESSSYFGSAVALSDTYALIGAYRISSYRGNAYLYNLGTGAWTDLATTAGQPITALAGSSYFGYAVALSDTYALIGAYRISIYRGNAYLYNLGTGAWTDLATTAGQPITGLASSSYFGTDVALNDNYALIGAYGVSSTRGTAYLYNLGTGAWTDLATTAGQPITGLASSSYFGYAVALSDTYALIGAYRISSYRGNAYLYNLGTGAWT